MKSRMKLIGRDECLKKGNTRGFGPVKADCLCLDEGVKCIFIDKEEQCEELEKHMIGSEYIGLDAEW